MVKEPIFRKSLLVAALFATLSFPVLALDKPANLEELRGAYEIGDWNVICEGERIDEDTRIEMSVRDGSDVDEFVETSILKLANLQIAETARLALSLKNDAENGELPIRGYWCGASFLPDERRRGSWGIDVEADVGTLFLVGNKNEPNVIDSLVTYALDNVHGGVGDPLSLMVFQQSLKLTKNDRFAIGTTFEEANRKGANLLVGPYGVLVIDQGHFDLTKTVIEADPGTKIQFEEGSAILVANGKLMLPEFDHTAAPMPDIYFISPGASVLGLDRVVFVNAQTGEEGHFEQSKSGALKLVTGEWTAQGTVAAPLNALHQQLRTNNAPTAVMRFFERFPVSAWAVKAVETNTLLTKSLGTTVAMNDAAADGARFAHKAFLKNKKLLPVSVEMIGGWNKGNTDGGNGLINTFERETEGIALSTRGVYGEWLWGSRLLYEDANVDVNSAFINRAAVDAESTLLAGSLYVGKRIDRMTVVADVTVTGAEDRVDFLQTDHVKIGSDNISRRSVSLGVTGLYKPTTELYGWMPAVKVGLQVTDYLKTEYDLKIDGENLWKVEEENRLVATADLGVELEKTWHRYTRIVGEADGKRQMRHDWLSLGLSGGVRVRANDLDITQRVKAAGASAALETDDLGKWEAYAGVAVDASWKDALFGLSAEGLWGAEDREACRMSVKVVWEF